MVLRQTSLLAYKEINDENIIGERQKIIYESFMKFGDSTDMEICRFLNKTDPNWVRPRRNELVKMGLLEEKHKRMCMITKKKAIVWGVL